MGNEAKVAQRVREFRERLGMSPAELAEKCGIDAVVLASVESGEVIPALGVMAKIARALGQRIGTFMDDQYRPDPIVTRRADACASAGEVGMLGYAAHSLAAGKSDRHMDPYRIDLVADGSARTSSHEGEELLICIEGEVELVYGEQRLTLAPGDTAYYNSVVRHSVRALGGKPASIYGVVYLPA